MLKPYNHIGIIAALIAAAALLSLTGCSDDLFPDKEGGMYSDTICFSTPDNATWPDTRSGQSATPVTRFALRSPESNDTLCVSMSVCDFDDTGTQLTRAALATTETMHTDLGVSGWVSANGGTSWTAYFNNEQNLKPAATDAPWPYSSGNKYYWPGEEFKMRFFAYSPYASTSYGLTYMQDDSGLNPRLHYEVPMTAERQPDLLATPIFDTPGDNNAVVSLNFKHICTAVQFVEGHDIEPGSIKSIRLKGVYDKGTYSAASDSWTLASSTADFTQTTDYTVQQTESAPVTNDTGCFVMLPQTVPDGAVIEIEFYNNVVGETRTLSAPIAGQVWPQGKRVKYNISISPEFGLEFSTDTPNTVDAHYDIIPIKIKANGVNGNWSIKSDQSWVTIKSALTPYERNGYWLNVTNDYRDYCASVNVPVERQQTLSTATEGTDLVFYLFVAENATQADRKVTLTLKKDGLPAGTVPSASIEIVQKCPIWQGNAGWEVIEESFTLPYGFKWNRVVTLQKTVTEYPAIQEWWLKQQFKKQPTGFWDWLGSILYPQPVDYVNISRSGNTLTATIDYSQITNVSSSTSSTNGQSNTWNLYSNAEGTAFNGEQELIDQGYTIVSETGSLENTKIFAALYAILLNAFDIHKGEYSDRITYAIIPEQTDIKWYLPASGQFANGIGDMSGRYWSSTAITDNENAYSWDVSAASKPRMDRYKVRACRVNP